MPKRSLRNLRVAFVCFQSPFRFSLKLLGKLDGKTLFYARDMGANHSLHVENTVRMTKLVLQRSRCSSLVSQIESFALMGPVWIYINFPMLWNGSLCLCWLISLSFDAGCAKRVDAAMWRADVGRRFVVGSLGNPRLMINARLQRQSFKCEHLLSSPIIF